MAGLLFAAKVWRWGLLPACLLMLQLVSAQTAPAPAAHDDAKTLAYEAVAIHPSKMANGMMWNGNDDSFTTSGTTVRSLLMNAYDLILMDQIEGLPSWGDSDKFDIQAKMDAETAAALKNLPREARNKQRGQMLQAILAERFNLKIRRDTKVLPCYELVVAKGGAKLKESAPDAPGGYSMNTGSNSSFINGHGMQLTSLAYSLSNTVGRIIVDKTGLTGKYEIDLKWSPQENPGSDDSGPSIFTALQEQLGLKLEPTKAPVESIVIEHVERPTEN